MAEIYFSDAQLAERFRVSKPTIWRWVKSVQDFPAPIKFSPGCTRWAGSQIQEYERRKVELAAATKTQVAA